MPEEFRTRHLVMRVAELAAVVAVVIIAINALPGLDEVRSRLTDADPFWVVMIVLAELGSCLGYMLVFRSTFCSQMGWRLSYEIAMAELAANSLLPTGGAGGLALGVWALKQAGMPTAHIARRTVAFFVVTSAANFFVLIVVGLALFLGLLSGKHPVTLGLVPAVITAFGALVVGLSPRLLRALGKRGERIKREGLRGRVGNAVRDALAAGADGVDQARVLLRGHSFGVVVGSLAYVGFDIVGLGCGFAAVGSVPGFATLVLGYLIGQLGNLVPLPGGIGGTEGALIGIFALYGVNITDASAAVLLYRLFQLAIPALLGVPAFWFLRRTLMHAQDPAMVCAPLGVDTVRLPARAAS
jgi:glycosyltransferase 2 family protein